MIKEASIALLLAAAAAAAYAGAPASAEAPRAQARDCFSARSVNGFNPVGREAVDVRVGANRRYRLELAGYCPDVDWSWRIALRTRGGSSWICQGMDAELVIPSPTGPQSCLVTSVRRLTPEEIEAARRQR